MNYALCIVHLAFKSLAACRGASLPTRACGLSWCGQTVCFCFGLAGWLPSEDALPVAPPFGRRTEQRLAGAVLFARGGPESRLSASTRRCHPADFFAGIGLSFPIDSVGTVAAAGKPQSQSYAAGAGRNRGIRPRHARPGKAGHGRKRGIREEGGCGIRP